MAFSCAACCATACSRAWLSATAFLSAEDAGSAAAACSAAAAEMKKVCGGDAYAKIAEAVDEGKITEVGGRVM